MPTLQEKRAIREWVRDELNLTDDLEPAPPPEPPEVDPWEKFFPGQEVSPVPWRDAKPFDPIRVKGLNCIFLRIRDGAAYFIAPGPGDCEVHKRDLA